MKPAYFAFASDKPILPEKAADFLAALLRSSKVAAVATPCWTDDGLVVFQLVANPDTLVASADPFAPVMLRNAAEQLSEFTRQGLTKPVAVVVRSCEMRALVELAKLKQANLDNVLLIGADCAGTVVVKNFSGGSRALSGQMLASPQKAENLRTACTLCESRTPPVGDLIICGLGMDGNEPLLIEARSAAGAEVVQAAGARLAPNSAEPPAKRATVLGELAKAATDALANAKSDDLLKYLSRCARCYNCRNMCPICYCSECFFTANKLGYSSQKYLDWAERKGSLQFPTDVLLFHLTRMNHMITSCVGCGICESSCPNGIPLGRIYSVLRREVQAQFGYEAGRSLTEPLPVSVSA